MAAGSRRGPQAYAGTPGAVRAQGDPRMMANPQGYPGVTGGYQGDPSVSGGYQGYPGNQGYAGYRDTE